MPTSSRSDRDADRAKQTGTASLERLILRNGGLYRPAVDRLIAARLYVLIALNGCASRVKLEAVIAIDTAMLP